MLATCFFSSLFFFYPLFSFCRRLLSAFSIAATYINFVTPKTTKSTNELRNKYIPAWCWGEQALQFLVWQSKHRQWDKHFLNQWIFYDMQIHPALITIFVGQGWDDYETSENCSGQIVSKLQLQEFWKVEL